MSTRDKFLAEVEVYIARMGISAREFGLRVRGDTAMVYRLRDGASITLDAMDRARAYMRDNPPPSKKKRQAADRISV